MSTPHDRQAFSAADEAEKRAELQGLIEGYGVSWDAGTCHY